MAISFVVASTFDTSAASGDITIPTPSTGSIQAGDLAIAFIWGKTTSSVPSAPTTSGWTAVLSGDYYQSTYGTLHLWYKRTTSNGESCAFDIATGNPNGFVGGVVGIFRGVKSTGSPFSVAPTVSEGNSTSLTGSLVEPPSTDDMIVAFIGNGNDNTITAGGSYSAAWNLTSTSGTDGANVCIYLTGSTSSTPSATANATNNFQILSAALAAPSIIGTLTQTLADATISSAATVLVQATSAQTLADLALSATGTVLIQSALSQALEDVGISATAINTIAGTVSQTLEDAAIVATGEVKDRTISDGTLSITLDDVQITAYGTLLIQASVGVTLDDVQIVSRIFKWHWVDPDNDDTWTLAADDDDSWSDQADTDDSWTVQLDDDDTWTNDSSEATTWH